MRYGEDEERSINRYMPWIKASAWTCLGIVIFVALVLGYKLWLKPGPPKIEQLVEIQSNQTAFLIPLEGESKAGQAKFMSEEFLNQSKVATKRISLPLRKYYTGRWSNQYKWIPTAKVILVDRAPVTREWTKEESTGTSKRDEALWVESLDSIGFGTGVNITAMILEDDAAKFLYYFGGVSLENIVDKNIRGFVNSVLSREFAAYDLEKARAKKNEIFDKASDTAKEHFAKMGITISNLGLAEGMVYEDKEIQTSINNKFTAEMRIQVETQNNLAQEKVNTRNVDIAKAEKDAALEFQKAAEARKQMVNVEVTKILAEAKLVMANKWDGKLPEKILPQGSNLLLSVE